MGEELGLSTRAQCHHKNSFKYKRGKRAGVRKQDVITAAEVKVMATAGFEDRQGRELRNTGWSPEAGKG